MTRSLNLVLLFTSSQLRDMLQNECEFSMKDQYELNLIQFNAEDTLLITLFIGFSRPTPIIIAKNSSKDDISNIFCHSGKS